MVKQTKKLKYPEGLVEIPEDASPRTKKLTGGIGKTTGEQVKKKIQKSEARTKGK